MADENPPLIPPATPKKETVRITLPPKVGDAAKRETVRINVPGQAGATPLAGPKKETTRLPEVHSVPPPPAPFTAPPPPKPLGSTPPLPGIKPLGVPGAPKPPTLGPRPTVPLKAPPAPGATVAPGSTPPSAGVKPATAPAGKAPLMPKATVRMQPTQQLMPMKSAAPGAGLAAPVGTVAASEVEAADPLVNILSWVAVAAAVFGLVGCYLAYSA